jgi:hypothetical protein
MPAKVPIHVFQSPVRPFASAQIAANDMAINPKATDV